MIPIFDLDDTLYPERTFVESGFRAVAAWLSERFGWDAQECSASMLQVLEQRGRGAVFDELLASRSRLSRRLVRDCIRVYRHHRPEISLDKMAAWLLPQLGRRCYLVTDGHKIVQYNKIRALGIESLFKRIYITHRYGLRHAKPSTYCFNLIREAEGCSWSELAYIGDDPSKDFVNLKPLGVRTIRVLRGAHRALEADPGRDADIAISGLEELPELLFEKPV